MIEWNDCTEVQTSEKIPEVSEEGWDDTLTLSIRTSSSPDSNQGAASNEKIIDHNVYALEVIRQPNLNLNLWCFKSACSILPPIQTPCVVVIPDVCRRYWWKMASGLIRYNYPLLCIFNLKTTELDAVHSKHIQSALCWPLPWCLLAVNGPYGGWRASSFDAINFNISVPWRKVSEHTLYSGARRDSLSPLWTFKAESGCGGGGAGCVCNKTLPQQHKED